MSVPDIMPTLARGKHRSARRGACFMEMASYLAGERWSDRPRCTHPLLASVARLVNDNTPDAERQALAPLIPLVIGLRSDEPGWDVAIARQAAVAALPVAPESRQRALAVGLLTTERVACQLDGRVAGTLTDDARATLAAVPLAWEWARRFCAYDRRIAVTAYRRRAAPCIVVNSVAGIAETGRADRAELLRALLAGAIAGCRARAGHPPDVADPHAESSRSDLVPTGRRVCTYV